MKKNINIPTKIIYYSDNIDILRGINSETVDLIYLDPPFNKNDTFIGTNKRVQEIKEWYIGLQNERGMFTDENFDEIFKDNAQFKDIWNSNDIQKEWYGQIDRYNQELIKYLDSVRQSAVAGTFFYLIFMTIRLIEMHRILKDTGSIYLHCDATMSHYLKIIMDKVFGAKNFRNEIVWNYGKWSNITRSFQKNHDIILFYTKGEDYIFNPIYVPKRKQVAYHTNIINGQGQLLVYDENKTPQSIISRYIKKGYKIVNIKNEYVLENDTWTSIKDKSLNFLNSQSKERTGYPTQKPLALLDRIIKTSSNEGDVVLDPFCGCATTCVAAEKLERKWIGIDWNKQAYYMVYYRLHQSLVNTGEQAGLHMLYKNIILETKSPVRDDGDSELFYRVKTKQELKTYKTKTAEPRNIDPQYRKEAIDLLYDEQKGMCNGCNEYLKKTSLTLDHIEPWSQTHNNDIDNLQLLCYRCNNWKRTGTMAELIERLYREDAITKELYRGQKQKYSKKNGDALPLNA